MATPKSKRPNPTKVLELVIRKHGIEKLHASSRVPRTTLRRLRDRVANPSIETAERVLKPLGMKLVVTNR